MLSVKIQCIWNGVESFFFLTEHRMFFVLSRVEEKKACKNIDYHVVLSKRAQFCSLIKTPSGVYLPRRIISVVDFLRFMFVGLGFKCRFLCLP